MKYDMDDRVLIQGSIGRIKGSKMYADIIIDITHEKLDKSISVPYPLRT